MNNPLTPYALFYIAGFVSGMVVLYAFRRPWTQAEADATPDALDEDPERALRDKLQEIPVEEWGLNAVTAEYALFGGEYIAPVITHQDDTRRIIIGGCVKPGQMDMRINNAPVEISDEMRKWLKKFHARVQADKAALAVASVK